MYWAVHDDNIVGYIMLAMGSAGEERQADLGIDTYGHIPALAIARLATDERYERRGIGRYMTSYAIKFARRMAMDVGCRVVLANSVPDAVEFYEKMGFAKFPNWTSSLHRRLQHDPSDHSDTEACEGNGLVMMYLDMGMDRS